MNIHDLHTKKQQGKRFSSITAYDASFSRLIGQAGIELVLVGDSLGNVIQGKKTTIPVTLDEMAYHTDAVSRGGEAFFLVSDMPFMTYATSNDALVNAAVLMQAGAQMVKLEGGEWLGDTIFQLAERGLPVCAHIGLTPQSVHKMGGFKVQGKQREDAETILADALVLEEAGAELLVLECVPSSLGAQLAKRLRIPVIGIGAGPQTDAQILVLYDMLGISARIPKFSRNFLDGETSVLDALQAYADSVRNGRFPAPEHCFSDS